MSTIFSAEHLKEVALQTGFVKYRSKLRPHMFLDFLLFKHLDDSKVSLTDFVASLRSRFDKTLKKQSIHDKFTPQAVTFIKQLVNEQLNKQITASLKVVASDCIRRITIKDSTRFQIPSFLKEFFPGSGGGASEAGVHIQFEYDLLTGSITDLNLTDAKRQDTTDASQTVDAVQPGDLIIRDMGYFVQGVFKQIIETGAYFLSRVKPKTVFYEVKEGKEKKKPINMKALHRYMKKYQIVRMEKLVVTNQVKQPIRLIIERLPEQIVNNRLEKARKEAKKKGRQLSDDYLNYACFNLFITNTDKEALPIDSVINLYHIRWQIELRFKAFKSYCKLDQVKKMKKERFECQLYAKLLFILILWEIGYHFQIICYQCSGNLISLNVFYKMVTSEEVSTLRSSLQNPIVKLKGFLIKIYQTSREVLLQERRKGRLNLKDLLTLIIDNQCVND